MNDKPAVPSEAPLSEDELLEIRRAYHSLEISPGLGGLARNFEPDTGQPGGLFFQGPSKNPVFQGFPSAGEGTLRSTMFRDVADVRQPG
jgi:hypothetical protein